MIALLQRVTSAQVVVDGLTIGAIQEGLLILLGVQKGDSVEQSKRLAERTLNYRVFADDQGKMNLNVQEVQGEILVVPQFTLAANTKKGNRPSFQSAATPELGDTLYTHYCSQIQETLGSVSRGSFGADMKVTLTNDGPVTFWLEV